jgi:competence protein ComEA
VEWNRVIRELELTKKDRIGFLALAVLVMVAIFLPGFFKNHYARQDLIRYDSAWTAELEQWMATDSAEGVSTERKSSTWRNPPSYTKTAERELRPFPFDPNTLDVKGWQALGLPDRTIRIILNYRNKGGRFRKKDDLAKIYGITAEQFGSLEPFIQIQEKAPRSFEPYPVKTGRYLPTVTIVDINQADTTAFIALPGIGSKLAGRIVAFREKLGGFYSIAQVGEVYGLADSVFQKIKPYLAGGSTPVRKININTISFEQLKAHPYFRNQLATAIIAYRNEHGPFSTINDLKKVMAITEEIFKRIEPYISL